MAAFVISSVLHARKQEQTLVAFVDIKGAYDATWKDGLFLKLHAAGLRSKVWRLLRSVLSVRPTRLKVNGDLSELLEITVGLAQGSPLSGFAFTAFLDDLRKLFKDDDAGLLFLGSFLAGVFLMDDLTLFAPDEETLLKALDLLTAYSETWRLPMAPPPKSGVLVFGKCTRMFWPFAGMEIPTVRSTTILGVVYSDDRKWHLHVADKLQKAGQIKATLKRIGMLGGRLALTAVSTIVASLIWPVIDWQGRSSLLRQGAHARGPELGYLPVISGSRRPGYLP